MKNKNKKPRAENPTKLFKQFKETLELILDNIYAAGDIWYWFGRSRAEEDIDYVIDELDAARLNCRDLADDMQKLKTELEALVAKKADVKIKRRKTKKKQVNAKPNQENFKWSLV